MADSQEDPIISEEGPQEEELTTSEAVTNALAEREESLGATEPEGVGGTEATEATGTLPEEPQQSSEQWKDIFTSAGFSEIDSVDTAAERAVEAIRQRDEQLQQLAQQVRFYQDQQRFAGQGTPSTGQPASPEGSAPSTGEAMDSAADPLSSILDGWEDPRWAQQYVEVGEDGMRRLRDDLDDVTREKVVAVDKKMREWGDLLADPRKFAEAIDSRVERMIRQNFETGWNERTAQQQEQYAVDSFVSENADWLYRSDPATGQAWIDPVTNQYQYSDEGQAFLSYMQRAEQQGVASLSGQIDFAMRDINLDRMMRGQSPVGYAAPAEQAAAEPAQPSPEQQATERRAEMRGRKNTRPKIRTEVNGVSPDSGASPAGANAMSFGEETLELMKTGS